MTNRTVAPDMQLDANEPVLIHTGTCQNSRALGRVYVQMESTDLNLPHTVLTGHVSPHKARTLAFDLLDAADEAELAQQEKVRDDLAWASYHAYPQRVVVGLDGTHNDELDTYSLAFSRPLWCAEPETTELAPWEADLLGRVEERQFVVGSDGITTSELVLTFYDVNPEAVSVLFGRNDEPHDDWFRITSNHATD